MEFDTWVPFVRDNVPRTVVVAAAGAALALGLVYAWDSTMKSLFFLGIICCGNAVIWKMERWTAAQDREAVAAGVATRGWGVDTDCTVGDRLHVQREIQKKKAS